MAEPIEHQKTPDQHSSVVGGSSAARVIGCPGSVDLLAKVPDAVKNASSSYADEGTGLHEVMAYLVSEDVDPQMLSADERVDALFSEYSLDDQRFFDAVIPAYREFNKLLDELYAEAEAAGIADPEVRILVEQRVEFPGVDDAFGTADIIMRSPLRTVVWDWKFGAGVPVYASRRKLDPAGNIVPEEGSPYFEYGNDQLLFYATAARHTHPDYFGEDMTWPVTLIICQPRIGEGVPSRYDTDIYELEDFTTDLTDAVDEALSGKGAKAKGSYCRFAACKSICPLHLNGPEAAAEIAGKLKALKDQSLTQADVEKAEVELILPGEPTPSRFSYGEALALLLDIKEGLEPLLNGAAADAQTYLENGGQVPGYKLVPKKAGWDGWEDEQDADKFLGRRGLDTAERRVVKTITPAKARTLLKAKGDEKGVTLLAKYIRPGVSSGHTLAREDDARPAIETTASAIGKLAEKIASAGA